MATPGSARSDLPQRLALLARRLRLDPRHHAALLATPVGRAHYRQALSWLAFPLLGRLARVRRALLGSSTPVVAVTGSYGKSTAVRAMRAALGLSPAPERENSWSYLALALLAQRRGEPHVAEVGLSRPGQMRHYARMLRPRVAVLTALGGEHRIGFGDIAATAAEKRRLLLAVPPGGAVVLNADDPRVRAEAAGLAVRVVRFGLDAEAEVHAASWRPIWPRGGTAIELVAHGERCELTTGLVGEPGVRAALAAVAVGRELGLPLALLARRLAAVTPMPGRLEVMALPGGALALCDDYKSGAETFAPAFAALASAPAARRFAVLGDVTEPAAPQQQVYRRLGAEAGRVASRLLYLGNKFDAFAAGARDAGLPREAVSEHHDVREAAAVLARELAPGDVVLIKGRINQKLARVALALAGRRVGCAIRSCRADSFRCAECPLLEPGWGDRAPVT